MQPNLDRIMTALVILSLSIHRVCYITSVAWCENVALYDEVDEIRCASMFGLTVWKLVLMFVHFGYNKTVCPSLTRLIGAERK